MYDKNDFIDLDTFKVANILACLPQHLRQPLIDALQEHRPNIGYLSMRFEDLEQVDDEGIKAIIKATDYQDLVQALSVAQPPLIDQFSRNMANSLGHQFIKDIVKLQRTESPDQFFNAFDAKINIVAKAAKLRESGVINLDVRNDMAQDIPQSMVTEIKEELQQACEKAMAEVLSCYLPEAAAAVLCQRLDRERILQQMLNLDHYDSSDLFDDDEIEQLLCGIADEDVF